MTMTDPFTYEIDDSESIIEAIITAVASAKGKDVMDLPPLYREGLHPEGLNMLFSNGGQGRVEFNYCDTQVMVRDGEKVVILPSEELTI